ncbi:MAG: acetyl-CoA carboxylase biotin carboxyl carrier protein [Cyanobacteria bacterium J06638_28]
MELNFNEIRELVTVLSQTDVSELMLKSADFELTLRKQGTVVMANSPAAVTTTVASSSPVTEVVQPVVSPPVTEPTPPPKIDSDLVEVTSPMVGTFYRSPAPDESPFVDVGDRIQTGQTVCIIEAMKLMNELEAEVSGEIVEILVENSQPVEFGQPLMRVKPS